MKKLYRGFLSHRIVFVAGLVFVLLALTAVSLPKAEAVNELQFAMVTPANPEICRYSIALLDRGSLMPEEGVFSTNALEIAQACNAKVIVRLHGKTEDIMGPGGGLDLVKYEDRINDFAGLIDPYVASGTIISHLTIDEPHHCADWSMVCPGQTEVDEAANISKSYWPALETTVNTLPNYASAYQWVYTDRITFVYAYHKGELQTFVQNVLDFHGSGSINSIGWGIQAYAGGCPVFNQCPMTPVQVVEVGTAICTTLTGDFVSFSRYKPDFLTPEMTAAVETVRTLCGDPSTPPDWPFEVSGRVFADLDSDGVFDPPAETALAGVDVRLVYAADGSAQTRTTAASGAYQFSNMAPYTATVSVDGSTLPVGHYSRYGEELLLGVQLTEEVDFPVFLNGVGGIIYRDHNLNQTYDPPTDTPYAGVIARLHNGVGALVATTTSNALGKYAFRGLANDTYSVSLDPATIQQDWTGFPLNHAVTIAETTYFGSKSFGVQPPSNTVTGKVYADLNWNLLFDPPYESALAGVTVRLTATGSGSQYSATTNGQGDYTFSTLASGTYSLTIDSPTLPTGHVNTVNPQFVLTVLETRVQDFAVRVNGISGLVYRDNDANGAFDELIDDPYPGVTVKLVNGLGQPVGNTVSAADGMYEFRALADDAYSVSVDPLTVQPTWTPLPGSYAPVISATSFINGRDFGVQPPSNSLLGKVYADFNRNDLYDPPYELALSGVTVLLTFNDTGGQLSAVTSGAGDFQFGPLPPGGYTLSINGSTLPVGHLVSYTRTVAVISNETRIIDFPAWVNGVSGIVFRDNDANGDYDEPPDAPYAGVTVKLLNGLGSLVATRVSGADGMYEFRGLSDDTYTVSVDPLTVQPNWTAVPGSYSPTVTSTTLMGGRDFGVQPPTNTIIGKVFADLNRNELFDPPYEAGLSAVIVRLTFVGTGATLSTATSSAGDYQFGPLPPGSYTLSVNGNSLPMGHQITYTRTVSVFSNETRTVDFAARVNGISGLVYRDINEDLVYTPGVDLPHAGIVINLDGSGSSFETTTTDTTGYYEFRGLITDTYAISVDANSLGQDEFSYYTSKIRTVDIATHHQGIDFPIHTVDLGNLFVSSMTNGSAGGISFRKEDILSYNVTAGVWEMYIDLSDVGVSINLDAFNVNTDGSILMSFDKALTIPGLGAVDDSDIVRFAPTSVGSNTAGTFTMYFDGSAYQLTKDGEDIDAMAFTPDGRLVVSISGSGNAGFGTIQDEDLIVFDSTTSTWSMYFDGSDVGLDTTTAENINGVRIAANGDIYLSTVGNFTVTGVSGTGSDIFVCAAPVTGSNTSCTFTMYWDGSTHGFGSYVVDAIDLSD